jgi:hypothetical protein
MSHRAVERGGRAGNFYRGPRLNGGPEELDYGARNRQSMKEPYNFYRGPSILSTALMSQIGIFALKPYNLHGNIARFLLKNL